MLAQWDRPLQFHVHVHASVDKDRGGARVADRKAKNPSSLLFWNDLENDENLNACSWAARGLWACKLLPIASRSVHYGVVIIGEHPCRWDRDLPTLLAKASGVADPEAVKVVAATFLAMLTELVTSGAASVDNMGRIYNRRMVRDAKVSAERSRAGRQGALVTNASRQKSGKGVGKGGGKQVGKDHGNEVGKPVGKTAATESALNADGIGTIRDEPPPDGRQNLGNAAGNEVGKPVGSTLGKSSASSSLREDSDRVTALQAVTPEEHQTPSLVAARGSAGGAPHTTPIVGRPPMADRMAALLAERRKEAGAA